MNDRQRVIVGVLLTLATTIAAGCGKRGPATYPVAGRVMFADGSPLPGGTLEFQFEGGADQANARGLIAEDGTFRMITPPDNDGVLAGTHRVIVHAFAPDDSRAENERLRSPLRNTIHPRFEKYETSGLKVTVEPKPNDLTIKVERP